MWSWLETTNLKVTDIPSEDVNKIVTGLEEKQNEVKIQEIETEKEEKEEKEDTDEKEEADDEMPELEAKWEKDLDEKCERQCTSMCSKTVKFKVQRSHLILLSIAYVANVFLFMFNKKCN